MKERFGKRHKQSIAEFIRYRTGFDGMNIPFRSVQIINNESRLIVDVTNKNENKRDNSRIAHAERG